MSSKESEEFRKLVKAVLGMTSNEISSLQSSLPCELAFNDLRDSGKRHQKQEKTCPQNLHCVSYKSCLVRNAGCKTIPIEDSDWCEILPSKVVKKTIFSALRASDQALGICSQGLTKNKSNAAFTKPHVFCNRLRLLECLKDYYHAMDGDSDEKRAKVLEAHRKLWLSRLIPREVFVRFKLDDGHWQEPVLVSRAGPYSLQCLHLEKVEIQGGQDAFTFHAWNAPRDERLVLDHKDVEVCLTEPVVAEKTKAFGSHVLSWQCAGEWIPLLDFVAGQLLTALCARLKIPGHSKLNYKHKVELFLKWMQRSDEYVAQVLEQIPDKPPRKERKAAEDDDADQDCVFLPFHCFGLLKCSYSFSRPLFYLQSPQGFTTARANIMIIMLDSMNDFEKET